MTLGSISSVSLSGMNAAALGQYASAHNLANVLDPKAKRLVVSLSEAGREAGGVVAASMKESAQPPDLIGDLVSQNFSVYTFKANAVALRTLDEMAGTVLSLKR